MPKDSSTSSKNSVVDRIREMTRRYEKQRAAQVMASDDKPLPEIQGEVIELQNERIAELENQNQALSLEIALLRECVKAHRRTHE